MIILIFFIFFPCLLVDEGTKDFEYPSGTIMRPDPDPNVFPRV